MSQQTRPKSPWSDQQNESVMRLSREIEEGKAENARLRQEMDELREEIDSARAAAARLAEEQRALEACYQRLKNDARIGQHMSDCGCGTCADIAAVEAARRA